MKFKIYNKQDWPSLESSSYLNVSLRYLGTLGPWNPWTLELLGHLDLFPPPTPPHTSPYLYIVGHCGVGGWLEPWDLLLPATCSSSNLLPPNSSYLLPKGLRWLKSSYMKRFICNSAQKSFMGGGGGDIAIIATSSRSRSLRDLR